MRNINPYNHEWLVAYHWEVIRYFGPTQFVVCATAFHVDLCQHVSKVLRVNTAAVHFSLAYDHALRYHAQVCVACRLDGAVRVRSCGG